MDFLDIPKQHKYGATDKLLKILLTNNYFHKTGDEVSRAALMTYVERQYLSKNFGKLKERDILSLITKLINDKILDLSFVYQKPLLIATHRYFLLKQGKLIVSNSGIEDTQDRPQMVSNLTKENSGNLISINDVISPKEQDIKENACFFQFLVDRIQSYSGECPDLVKNLPLFFNLICNIISHKESNFNIKVLCSLALSYLVIEDDYYPDHRKDGYLDDLFVIVYAFKQIIEAESSSLLVKSWPYEGDIIQIIEETYSTLYDKIEDDIYEILKIVDLDKFSLYNSDLAEMRIK